MQSDHSESPEATTTTAAAADARLDTAELRRRIAQADRALAEEFWSGADIDELVAERGAVHRRVSGRDLAALVRTQRQPRAARRRRVRARRVAPPLRHRPAHSRQETQRRSGRHRGLRPAAVGLEARHRPQRADARRLQARGGAGCRGLHDDDGAPAPGRVAPPDGQARQGAGAQVHLAAQAFLPGQAGRAGRAASPVRQRGLRPRTPTSRARRAVCATSRPSSGSPSTTTIPRNSTNWWKPVS